jgi:hypothetical protein
MLLFWHGICSRFKTMKMIYSLIAVLILVGLTYAAEEGNEDWLNKHAVIITTEKVEQDGSGNVKSIKVTKDTTVYIKQVMVETRKPDKDGNIKISSRTTTSTDALGGSVVVNESMVAGKLVMTSVTVVEVTPDGNITTTSTRNKAGAMVPISKTISAVKKNGNSPTITIP